MNGVLVGPLEVYAAWRGEVESPSVLEHQTRAYLALSVSDPGQGWEWCAEACRRRLVDLLERGGALGPWPLFHAPALCAACRVVLLPDGLEYGLCDGCEAAVVDGQADDEPGVSCICGDGWVVTHGRHRAQCRMACLPAPAPALWSGSTLDDELARGDV